MIDCTKYKLLSVILVCLSLRIASLKHAHIPSVEGELDLLRKPNVRIIYPSNHSSLLAPFDRLVVRISGLTSQQSPMLLLLLDHSGRELMRMTVSVGEDDDDSVELPILLHGLQTMTDAITRIALLAPDQAGADPVKIISEDSVRFHVEVPSSTFLKA